MLEKTLWKTAAVGLALFCLNTTCHAFDSATFEFASGNKTQLVRAGIQQNWDRKWAQSNGTHITGYWDVTFAYWRANRHQNISDNTQNIADIGFTPVFRFVRDDRMGFYGEAGLGPHLLSAHYDNNGRKLSTNFQFGSHLGIGYVLPSKVDVGLRVEHVSNGGIKQPNNGVNFVGVRFGYPF